MRTSMKALLESGVHFGHQTRRWNPKMAKYIFAERNGIYIIDLQKTLRMLETACDYVQEIAAQGGTVLFVGTKRQSQEAVIEEATRCQMFYVNHRWLGGMLTNFQTIRRSIQRLEKLEADEANGVFDQLPKKEVIRLLREKTKLTNNLTGIKAMKRSPDAVIITDTRKEHTAILESNKLGIPVIGIVDTNCDPQLIDLPIPGNDDAIRAIRLICSVLATSINEGRGTASEGADISEAVQSEAVVESDEPEAAETSDEVKVRTTDGEEETPAGTAEATAKRPQRRKRASTKSQKSDTEIEPREAEATVAQALAEDSATKAKTGDDAESKPKPARRKRRTSTKAKKANAETETPKAETAATGSISEDSTTREKTEPVEADSTAKPVRRKRRTSAKTKKADAETETPEVDTAATEPISQDSGTEDKAESVETDSTAKPARRKRRTSTKTKKADAEATEDKASDTPESPTTTVADDTTEAEA